MDEYFEDETLSKAEFIGTHIDAVGGYLLPLPPLRYGIVFADGSVYCGGTT
jgi:hypothetical protein